MGTFITIIAITKHSTVIPTIAKHPTSNLRSILILEYDRDRCWSLDPLYYVVFGRSARSKLFSKVTPRSRDSFAGRSL